MSYNRFVGLGNLARDPELRVTPTGQSICQFCVALNHKYKDGSGNVREDVTFLDCEAWGKQAEVITQYFSKGSRIMVDGRIKQSNWEDKTTGQKRSKLSLVVGEFQFIDRNTNQQGQQDSQETQRYTPPPRQRPQTQTQMPDIGDDDVPF